MRHHFVAGRRHRRERASGQAMVEFALLAPVLVLIVAGIVQFGVGLNFWFDMHRLANQGARWAVVNHWPACPRTSANAPAPHPGDGCTADLQRYIACQPVAEAMKPTVAVSFPAGSSATKRGDPVQVTVSAPFTFVPIVGIGTITLSAKAEMKIEQDAVRYDEADTYTPGACP